MFDTDTVRRRVGRFSISPSRRQAAFDCSLETIRFFRANSLCAREEEYLDPGGRVGCGASTALLGSWAAGVPGPCGRCMSDVRVEPYPVGILL
eukprot:6883756-Pyramimonas_sp.AAC.3